MNGHTHVYIHLFWRSALCVHAQNNQVFQPSKPVPRSRARVTHQLRLSPATMQSSAVGLLLAVTALQVYGADRRQSYSVLAPRAIRPNTNYYAAVSVDGTDGDLQVIVSVIV